MGVDRTKLFFSLFLINICICNISLYSQKSKDAHTEFYNYLKWSENYASQKQFDSANKYVQRAIEYSDRSNDIDITALANLNKATILYWQAIPNDAKPYLQFNIENDQITDSIIIKSRLTYSSILSYQKLYKQALLQSVKTEEQLNSYKSLTPRDSLDYTNTYLGMASIHKQSGNFDQAILMYDKAIKYCTDLGNKSYIIFKKGNIYNKDEQIDFAIEKTKEALNIAESNNLKLYIPTYYLALSEYELALKNSDSTIYYATRGLHNNTDCHIDGLNNMVGEGLMLANNYKEAIPFFEKALDVENVEIDQAIIHKNLSKSYSKTGNHKQALEENSIYLRLKDSTDALRIKQEIYEITERYESDKKQLEIEALSAENKYNQETIILQKNRILLIVISLIIVTALTIWVLIMYVHQKRKDELLYLKNVQLAKRLKEAESQRLSNTSHIIEKERTELSIDKKKELLEYIETLVSQQFYLKKDMTLATMAKLMNTNTSYLSKIINEVKGQSFANFLSCLRIDHTLASLESDASFGNLTIEHIADVSGFNSSSAFYKAFKKYTGLTPSYYIKRKIKLV